MSEAASRVKPGGRLKSVLGADHHTNALIVDRILMIILITLRWDDPGCNGGRAVIIGLEFRAIW